jgi:hypothetical protein
LKDAFSAVPMSAFGGKSDAFCSYACAAGTSAIFRAQKTRRGKQSGKQQASHRNRRWCGVAAPAAMAPQAPETTISAQRAQNGPANLSN